MPNILICLEASAITAAQRDEVTALAPDYTLLITNERSEIEAALPDAEIMAGHFLRDLLPQATAVRWIQSWGAGVDWLMRHPELARRDELTITNASGVHAIPISEHIIAFLLSFGRRFPQAIRAQSRNEWVKQGEQVTELAGKTMLLIGVGAIGARTARLAKALDMHVIGLRRNPEQGDPFVDEMIGPSQLLDFLPQADFVVLTLPLTPESKGMIGEAELRAMKSTAYISNIGRGGTIQEDKLIRALQEGWIAGAGLDVFATEPLPADSPLWQMDNVTITAHYSGSNPSYNERAFAIFIDNLQRYLQNKPMRNLVDKTLGY